MKLIDPIYNIQSPLPQTPRAGYTMSETHIPHSCGLESSQLSQRTQPYPGTRASRSTTNTYLDA